MNLIYEDLLELIGENVVIIEYVAYNKTPYQHASGIMVMLEDFYKRRTRKINKALKDCEIMNLYQGTLTHEVVERYIGEKK